MARITLEELQKKFNKRTKKRKNYSANKEGLSPKKRDSSYISGKTITYGISIKRDKIGRMNGQVDGKHYVGK